jgi:hypothetical protein
MSFKTISIIILSVCVTILFMQNTDAVSFTIFFSSVSISKLWLMAIMLVVGFILGAMLTKPQAALPTKSFNANVPLEVNNIDDDDQEYIRMEPKKGLSDEDRDYIN